MASVTEAQIRDALRAIPAPDGGGDIVARGMVTGLVLKNGNVGFSIEVDPRQGPKLEPLRKAAEKAVEQLPGVLSVTKDTFRRADEDQNSTDFLKLSGDNGVWQSVGGADQAGKGVVIGVIDTGIWPENVRRTT